MGERMDDSKRQLCPLHPHLPLLQGALTEAAALDTAGPSPLLLLLLLEALPLSASQHHPGEYQYSKPFCGVYHFSM